jgi:hypothetical protein
VNAIHAILAASARSDPAGTTSRRADRRILGTALPRMPSQPVPAHLPASDHETACWKVPLAGPGYPVR